MSKIIKELAIKLQKAIANEKIDSAKNILRDSNEETVKQLLNYHNKKINGATALLVATVYDNVEIVRCLIEDYKADTSVTNMYEQNLLHLAAKNGANKVLAYIIKKDGGDLFQSLNVEASDGLTALKLAKANKQKESIELIESVKTYEQETSWISSVFNFFRKKDDYQSLPPDDKRPSTPLMT